MNMREQKGDDSIPSGSSNIANFDHRRSKITGLADYAHTAINFHLISAMCQVGLGITVVVLTTAGLIKPLWLSVLLSMAGSVTTISGLYLMYSLVSRGDDTTRLLRDAMRRIMDAKN